MIIFSTPKIENALANFPIFNVFSLSPFSSDKEESGIATQILSFIFIR
jgi:hypothetical protein